MDTLVFWYGMTGPQKTCYQTDRSSTSGLVVWWINTIPLKPSSWPHERNPSFKRESHLSCETRLPRIILSHRWPVFKCFSFFTPQNINQGNAKLEEVFAYRVLFTRIMRSINGLQIHGVSLGVAITPTETLNGTGRFSPHLVTFHGTCIPWDSTTIRIMVFPQFRWLKLYK